MRGPERFLFLRPRCGRAEVLTATVPEADANRLRKMGDFLRDKEPKVVAVLAAVNGEKITFLAVCGKDAVKAGVKAGHHQAGVRHRRRLRRRQARLRHGRAARTPDGRQCPGNGGQSGSMKLGV